MTITNHIGLVLRSTGSHYSVHLGEEGVVECQIRGKFRMQGIKSTNPVAVGDRVEVERSGGEIPVIKKILKRENYIIRKATRQSKQTHIIAANLDQAIFVVTLAFPRTSTGFIDRFLVTAEAYHIPVLLVFNKIDLYDEALAHKHGEMVRLYEDIGYHCVSVSAKTGEGMDEIRHLLAGKVSLLAGHSGVGKSALANAIDPELDLKTGVISQVHNKGKHTTTFAQMHILKQGGYLVDTPGIKEFGLVDMERVEVAQRFPEMRSRMHRCRFHNCTHTNEPGCAVKEAVEAGLIAPSRYRNYMHILKEDIEDPLNYW
ncbi:MAG: ribosome small subunit-dependent GTPase A [Bacteroidetes bacterium]|nr:MAG: ribosome small subunit-dependent GTPase A [Bacteroidota bacterium]PIE87576.1 MAG: ribosome small subunit-dependent GTPase A [Bacteroidota bacterium]